jgi:hypothetical protein
VNKFGFSDERTKAVEATYPRAENTIYIKTMWLEFGRVNVYASIPQKERK